MPKEFTEIIVDGSRADVTSTDDLPITFDYKLEDDADFQNKSGSKAVDIVFPATKNNQKIFNDFSNPSSEDFTPGKQHRKLKVVEIRNNGAEYLVGKLQLNEGSHTDTPLEYVASAFGQNSDWALALKEKTLYDFVTAHTHIFGDGSNGSPTTIQSSWNFDGLSEVNDYVYAPIIFRDIGISLNDIRATMMTPSISLYWVLWRAFASIGYKLESDFFDTNYFRRLVMPFTWFDFRRLDPEFNERFFFRAKQVGFHRIKFGSANNSFAQPFLGQLNGVTVHDFNMGNDFFDGGFDNGQGANGNYIYLFPETMRFIPQITPAVGNVTFRFYLTFEMKYEVIGGAFGNMELVAQPFVGAPVVVPIKAFPPTTNSSFDIFETFAVAIDVPMSIATGFVDFKVFFPWDTTSSGSIEVEIRKMQLFNDEIFRDFGGVVNFKEMGAFKKIPILDVVAGVFDYFDLQTQSDSGSKIVRIEPYFAHSLDDDPVTTNEGYIRERTLNWKEKQDLSKKNVLELFNNAKQLQEFQAKQDDNDGIQKIYREKYGTPVGLSDYQLPDRFKSGVKKNENRFFSPMMHYRMLEMKRKINSPTIAQICVLIEENISQTSERTARSLFEPKLCFYKGLVNQQWNFNNIVHNTYPFMFQVNYNIGGENDPIISYCDEQIGEPGTAPVIGRGLMKRFYLQRLAIMRNGQRYKQAYFLLNQNDFQNWLHREFIHVDNNKFILKEISGFNPEKRQSVACVLDKWTPIIQEDFDACFPSQQSVLNGNLVLNTQDIKYVRKLCLASEILKAIENE